MIRPTIEYGGTEYFVDAERGVLICLDNPDATVRFDEMEHEEQEEVYWLLQGRIDELQGICAVLDTLMSKVVKDTGDWDKWVSNKGA